MKCIRLLSIFLLLLLTTSFFPILSYAESINSPDFQAGMLPKDWDEHVDKNKMSSEDKANLPKSNAGGGLEQLQDLVIHNAGKITKYLLISISIIFIFINLLILLFTSSDEGKVTEVKSSIAYILLGLLLISGSGELAKIFDPTNLGKDSDIANKDQVIVITQYIINFIALFAGIITTFFIFLSGARLIYSQGEEEEVTSAKRNLLYSFTGLIVITMSDIMVNDVFYPIKNRTDQDPGAAQAPGVIEISTFTQEAFGLIKYGLQFLGMVGILLIILAGIYYLISMGDTGKTDQAKRILKNIIFSFLVITFAYIIVKTFIPS